MLAMEYGLPMGHPQNQQTQIKYASSTMSSETISESCGSRNNRIRTIRLVRPTNLTLPPPNLTCKHGPNLGFSVRGGREHGTGFFVSYVEVGSEAHRQGLRVGDQIIRINGFTIEDAVHKEVLQLISNHTHLTLKVRSVGMIPVKDKRSDSLSWQIITNDNSSLRGSPPLDKIQDLRINIMVAPRSKLGCGICKGPEWKPGIFIQFTKEGGIAREAGLRPGDQILFCNNVDFSDIPFNEAVNLMKTARQLDLVVRKSAGSELFPGESSGYNSSASSVTGDQSPSWSDSKRLSIVKEENLDLEDRLSHLDHRFKNLPNSKWDTKEWNEINQEKPFFKPTIINLSENGTTIKNNGTEAECRNIEDNTTTTNKHLENENKLADICLVSQQHEMKTVVVEVHRSDEEKPKPEICPPPSHNLLMKSASTSSFGSIASNTTTSSLSSAIHQEIQRRTQKKTTSSDSDDSKPSIDEQLQIKKILKNVSSDKQFQHSRLMDEFKKAHQKMFRTASGTETTQPICSNTLKTNSTKETMDRLASKELSEKLSERLTNLTMNQSLDNLPNSTNSTSSTSSSNSTPPPPPPPLPSDDNEPEKNHNFDSKNSTLKPNKTKPKAPPVPVKYSTLSYTQTTNNNNKINNKNTQNNTNNYQNVIYQSDMEPAKKNPENIYAGMNGTRKSAYPLPDYYCPTPDYDTISIASSTTSTSTFRPGQFNDSVEMDSLESFKLHMHNEIPKPPNTYFKKPLAGQISNGSTTNSSINGTLRKQRPVSVTIGEYPTMKRQQPGKLDFINQNSNTVGSPKQPISSQLATELAQTLNRSNLRKRTESVENLLQSRQEISPQTNGSVRISLNTPLARNLAKSTNDLSCNTYEKINLSRTTGMNRVTININNGQCQKDSPNGILKNTANGSQTVVSNHKPLSQQKSITFGEMPTLTKERTVQVT